MRLTPPTQAAFWISVVLVVLGFLGTLATIPFVSGAAFWFVLVGYIVLFLGLVVKGF